MHASSIVSAMGFVFVYHGPIAFASQSRRSCSERSTETLKVLKRALCLGVYCILVSLHDATLSNAATPCPKDRTQSTAKQKTFLIV